MKCTIKDIASDTGLSLATISKYLNGKKVLPENQTLIQDSIKSLGYIPNKTAQTLRRRRTDTIAILLPVISDYFWGSICGHIEESMQKRNYSTLICSYDPLQTDQSDVYHHLLSVQVNGVILVPQNLEEINLAHLLRKGRIPFIYLDQVISDPPADSVTSDNFIGAKKATEYLLRRGHKNLCVIGGDLNSYTNAERVRGFLAACSEYKIPPRQRAVFGKDFSMESAFQSFQKMLALPNRPSAVLFLGYFLTVAAIQEISSQKIQIPKDLSIISFDDDEIFSAFDPPITAMVQNLPEIGKRAAEMLIKRMEGDFSGFPNTVIVETGMIERESVMSE